MFFDLRSSDRVTIEAWSSGIRGRIIDGDSMLDLITEITKITGRMRPLPAWTQKGAVVGLEGGSEIVENKLQKLRSKKDFPISGIWLQDWSGLRKVFEGDRLVWNWNLDKSHYSSWDQTLQKLKDDNIRMLTYVNPFFSINEAEFDKNNRLNLVEQGNKLGYFVKNIKGKSYVIYSGTIKYSIS